MSYNSYIVPIDNMKESEIIVHKLKARITELENRMYNKKFWTGGEIDIFKREIYLTVEKLNKELIRNNNQDTL